MKTGNLTKALYDSLLDRILSGSLKPGDRLPPLRSIALEYELSRSVVNNAISLLAAKGYLKIKERHYIVVTDFLREGTLDVIMDIFTSETAPLRTKLIEDVLAIRKLAELEAIDHIMNQGIDIAPLEALVDNEIAHDDTHQDLDWIIEADMAFHEGLVALSSNMVLSILYRSFRDIERSLIQRFYEKIQDPNQIVISHRKFVEMLRNQQYMEARSLWAYLLEQGRTTIMNDADHS
ncbi:MAG: GntR family transcriptional regulator [Candidatus Izemoplasmatales bacterium]|nr:GntR family transcriptional regulator [Candidatus Izemoplasmatales bacterium]MDD5292993.1 GntR family transcriptional regulator [Candidatus Izemoplasmatales bacterium]